MIDFQGEFFDLFKLSYHFKYHSLKKLLSFKKEPIFIGGCGRSGTTLLLSILAAHSKIYGITPETNIYGYSRKFKSVFFNSLNNKRKIYYYLLQNNIKNTAHRWCEKTPRNIRYFTTIYKEFNGRVKLIEIVRDGRDVVTSKMPNSNEYHIPINRWINDVNSGIKQKSEIDFYTIRYEDLVLDHKKTLKGIFKYLDEPFEKDILQFYERSDVIKHSAWENNLVQPIYNLSIGKWKSKEHIGILDKFMNNSEALKLLEYYRYI